MSLMIWLTAVFDLWVWFDCSVWLLLVLPEHLAGAVNSVKTAQFPLLRHGLRPTPWAWAGTLSYQNLQHWCSVCWNWFDDQCSVFFFFNSLCLREKIGEHWLIWDPCHAKDGIAPVCRFHRANWASCAEDDRKWDACGMRWTSGWHWSLGEMWLDLSPCLDLWINAKRGQLSFEVWTFAEGNIKGNRVWVWVWNHQTQINLMFSVHVLLSGSHSDAIDLKVCGQHRHVVSYHVQNQVLHSRFNNFLSESNQWVSKSESSESKDLTANLRQGNQSIIVWPRAGTKKSGWGTQLAQCKSNEIEAMHSK